MRWVLFAVMLVMAQPACADVITLRADKWCPYNCEVGSKKPGYGIEILKAIFEKAGHSVDYQNMPWTEAISRTRTGDFVAIIGATKTETPDFLYPEESVGRSQTAFAIRKDDSFEYGGPSSLETKKIGAIQSYSYDTVTDAYITANKDDQSRILFASGASALEVNLRKLISGGLDAVVDDTNVLLFKLDEMQKSDLVKIFRSENSAEVFIAFSPKNPKAKEYAQLFDAGMAELRKNGQLATILTRYGLKDWKN